MKAAGIVLASLGGLMILSGLNLAATKYDLGSSHDLSKFLGALGVSVLILLGGVALVLKADKKR